MPKYKRYSVNRRIKEQETPYHYTIYRLRDPITNQIRWIGQTWDLVRRYNQHLRGNDPYHKEKNAWIQDLIAAHHLPLMETIEHIYALRADAKVRENYWIDYYRKQGEPLFNKPWSDSVIGTREESFIYFLQLLSSEAWNGLCEFHANLLSELPNAKNIFQENYEWWLEGQLKAYIYRIEKIIEELQRKQKDR